MVPLSPQMMTSHNCKQETLCIIKDPGLWLPMKKNRDSGLSSWRGRQRPCRSVLQPHASLFLTKQVINLTKHLFSQHYSRCIMPRAMVAHTKKVVCAREVIRSPQSDDMEPAFAYVHAIC